MIVFYLTCGILVLIILGVIITNVYERIVEARPRTPVAHQKDDASWKTYRPR